MGMLSAVLVATTCMFVTAKPSRCLCAQPQYSSAPHPALPCMCACTAHAVCTPSTWQDRQPQSAAHTSSSRGPYNWLTGVTGC